MQLLLKPDFLNFSHVMRTNQSKFSKFGRWKFIDHRFFFLFFRGIPLEETSSHDYDKLLAAWKGWRDVTGPKMKQNYTDYVRLKNEALKIAGESFLL